MFILTNMFYIYSYINQTSRCNDLQKITTND